MNDNLKLSTHSIMRLRERTEFEEKEFIENVKIARKLGLSYKDLSAKHGESFNFLIPKYYDRIKKYYNGYLYIFSKNKKTLITVFKVEDKELKKSLDELFLEKKKNLR